MAEHKYPGTQKAYDADLRRTAKEAIKQADENAAGREGLDDGYDDAYEIDQIAHEYADNEVIYTYRVREILTWTDNLDAYEDQMGDIEGGSVITVLTQIAYFAYKQDLMDEIERQLARGNPAKKNPRPRAKKNAKPKPKVKGNPLAKMLRI